MLSTSALEYIRSAVEVQGPRNNSENVGSRLQSRTLAIRVCALALLLCTSPAWAGNSDSFYLSGEAAMHGGAVVANSTGGGSVWYNPAGLSTLEGMRLDVNVSGYAIRLGATANFDSAVPGATETRLSLVDINVVPAALTLTRRFGDVGVGIGIFVPSQSVVSLRTNLSAPADATGTSLDFGYDSKRRVQEYHLGPGFGWAPTHRLSLGSSLLLNYRTHYESIDVAATVENEDAIYSMADHSTIDSIGVGLEMIFGAQYRIVPNWNLGLVVRTPAFSLGHAADLVETKLAVSSEGDVQETISYSEELGLGMKLLTPFRFHLGLSHEWGDLQASAEGSLLLPFDNRLFDMQQRPTWNARFGLRGQLSDTWSLGGGIYTDRSSSEDPVEFQDQQLDFYGVTIAADWLSSYGVYAEDGEALEEPRSLIFGTTVALSYALGIGEIASAVVGPASGGGIEITPLSADVVAHEFTLHISSSIAE